MTAAVPNNVNVYQDTPNRVTVDQDAQNLVVVRSTSASSASTRRYTHLQNTASSEWNITHTLGGKPVVTVVDSAGTVVIGEVQYINNTEVKVTFSSPFSGTAYLT